MDLKDLEKRVKRLEQEVRHNVTPLEVNPLLWEAFFALEWLVRLKNEKDSHGKTDGYLEARDGAWSDARAVVSEIRKLRDEGYE